jgi:hypothetical protein
VDAGIRQAIAAKCAVMLFVRAIRSNTLEFADGDLWAINLAVIAGYTSQTKTRCISVTVPVAFTEREWTWVKKWLEPHKSAQMQLSSGLSMLESIVMNDFRRNSKAPHFIESKWSTRDT